MMKTLPLLATLAALFAFDAVAPAAAQPWGPPPPPPPHGPGWGPPPPPPHWRMPPPPRRCWIEERRVRVFTDHGPRWRIREVRVCR